MKGQVHKLNRMSVRLVGVNALELPAGSVNMIPALRCPTIFGPLRPIFLVLGGKLLEEARIHERAVVLAIVKLPEQKLLVLCPVCDAHFWIHTRGSSPDLTIN